MDKQTLSNYGWLVIITLVLAVMLVFATPFGKYVGNGVVSIASGFVDASDSAVDEENIAKNEEKWANKLASNSLNVIGTIPEGATYIGADGVVYNFGDELPKTPKDGDVFEYGDYRYTFGMSLAYDKPEWNPKVIDKTKSEYGPLLESINDRPLLQLDHTFEGCSNLTNLPKIPKTVVAMYMTYGNCTSLVDASNIVIPKGVKDIGGLFLNCTNLEVAPKIPNTILYMDLTFCECKALTQAPIIPDSVKTERQQIFYGCTNLGY